MKDYTINEVINVDNPDIPQILVAVQVSVEGESEYDSRVEAVKIALSSVSLASVIRFYSHENVSTFGIAEKNPVKLALDAAGFTEHEITTVSYDDRVYTAADEAGVED
jgi:hypothetical protein